MDYFPWPSDCFERLEKDLTAVKKTLTKMHVRPCEFISSHIVGPSNL